MGVRELFQRLIGRRPGTASDTEARRDSDHEYLSRPSKRVLAPEEARALPPIIVGVDLGTSGTKIAFRDLSQADRVPHVLDVGTDTAGFARFAVPSTVVQVGDRLVVGGPAEAAAPNATRTVRSPKRGLLDNDATPWDPDQPSGPRRDDLAAALVIGEAVRRFRAVLPDFGGTHRRLGFNLDVPVAEIGDDSVAARFQRVLQAGRFFARELEAECTEGDAVDAWMASADTDVASQGLLPEAQVVMKGMEAVLPLALDRKHVIVDAGAGTLDVGVFKVYRYADGQRIAFWASETIPLGCDHIDGRIAEIVFGPRAGTDQALLGQVRAAKIAAARGRAAAVGGRPLLAQEVGDAVHWFDGQFRPTYRDVIGRAYGKEKILNLWRDVGVIVMGGGSLLSGLAQRLRSSPAHGIPFQAILPRGEPRCSVLGASRRAPTPEEIPFLIAAVGLTFSGLELEELIRPSEVMDDSPRSRSTGVYEYDAEAMWGH